MLARTLSLSLKIESVTAKLRAICKEKKKNGARCATSSWKAEESESGRISRPFH